MAGAADVRAGGRVIAMDTALTVKIEISFEEVANLFCSAVESGDPVTSAARGGWCAGIHPVGGSKKLAERLKAEGKHNWYAEAEFWAPGALIDIFEVDDESKEWNVEKRKNVIVHRINPAKLRDGFAIMAKKFPRVFASILDDNSDATTADILLQCLCFGEEKYA